MPADEVSTCSTNGEPVAGRGPTSGAAGAVGVGASVRGRAPVGRRTALFAGFRAPAFFAGPARFTADFFVAAFLADVGRAPAFFTAAFFAGAFLVAVFFAAGFRVAAFFVAGVRRDDFFTALLLRDFVAMMSPFPGKHAS
ncbi:hypothetical protein [Pyxidicoccus fallax]|uniref:hypothetical protein n=1 Tax=Pyxidicoccus fallax TaxID=394095 RepID=UPI001FEC6453|nr:hypothetical protein [Pyxidicoccus fallax]